MASDHVPELPLRPGSALGFPWGVCVVFLLPAWIVYRHSPSDDATRMGEAMGTMVFPLFLTWVAFKVTGKRWLTILAAIVLAIGYSSSESRTNQTAREAEQTAVLEFQGKQAACTRLQDEFDDAGGLSTSGTETKAALAARQAIAQRILGTSRELVDWLGGAFLRQRLIERGVRASWIEDLVARWAAQPSMANARLLLDAHLLGWNGIDDLLGVLQAAHGNWSIPAGGSLLDCVFTEAASDVDRARASSAIEAINKSEEDRRAQLDRMATPQRR